jgi:hypothetical protein
VAMAEDRERRFLLATSSALFRTGSNKCCQDFSPFSVFPRFSEDPIARLHEILKGLDLGASRLRALRRVELDANGAGGGRRERTKEAGCDVANHVASSWGIASAFGVLCSDAQGGKRTRGSHAEN